MNAENPTILSQLLIKTLIETKLLMTAFVNSMKFFFF